MFDLKHIFILLLMFLTFINCNKSNDPMGSKSGRISLDLSGFENQYQLVYVNDSEIYTIDSDGQNLKRLTENSDYDHAPRWTPSGGEIIFVSKRAGDLSINIYKMNADGSGQENISRTDCFCANPVVSPDGFTVAYVEYCESDTLASLIVMNIDGSNKKTITRMFAMSDPVYSPDGSKILFSGSFLSASCLFVIDVNGENLVQLTDTTRSDYHPGWSPTGDRIVYTSCDDDCEIFIMDTDGKNQQDLTNHYGWDNFPDWSADGASIYFLSDRGGDKDLFRINPDGSGLINVTDDSYDSYYLPTSSPDGTRIAYAANTDGDDSNETIFIMDTQTGKYKKLTEGYISPQWGITVLTASALTD